jgi:hypothetical protein
MFNLFVDVVTPLYKSDVMQSVIVYANRFLVFARQKTSEAKSAVVM